MGKERHQLAGGPITVWLQNEKVVMHHANGLTLELSPQERADFLTWLTQQETGRQIYRLKGRISVVQYCHVQYPEKTGLPILSMCPPGEGNCTGHEIFLEHEEEVEAESPKDAIGNESLTKFEGLGDVEGVGAFNCFQKCIQTYSF
jgi:hypothetical protein